MVLEVKKGKTTNWKQVELGEDNYFRVRLFFLQHLCATQRECAKELGLSVMAVNRHVKRIRDTWKAGSN